MWRYRVRYNWIGNILDRYTDTVEEAVDFRKIYGGIITEYRDLSPQEIEEIEKRMAGMIDYPAD